MAPQPPRPKPRAKPVMTRDEVGALISMGRKILIFDQLVLKVDPWLSYHPGGDKALLHMVGKDATDEIRALHSEEAQKRMTQYAIGRIRGTWMNFVPPIQGGDFTTISSLDAAPYGESKSQRRDDLSACSSRSSSSVSIPGDMEVRSRKPAEDAMHTAPSQVQHSGNKITSEMSFLDALTREEISLDAEKYPSADAITQQNIVAKYRSLHEKIINEDLYVCSRTAYLFECGRYVGFFGTMLVFLVYGHYTLSAICLGLTWHQLVFLAHDAGHMGVTHNYQIDTIIGILVADFVGGLSLGWWKRNHNVHHIVTNAPEHDPDIEHMPLFAVSHRLLGSLRSTYYDRVMEYDAVAKFLLRIQPWTYYPLLAFGRFNLYRLSWDYLLARRGPRRGPGAWHWYLELVGQVFFWAWFGYGILYKMLPDGWSRFIFVMVSHITSSPLHVQIVLSHFAMSTSDLGPQESFAQRMLRTTMDVDCPPWLDFVHGGLQFQAIHHLFPRIPRHNLRKTQRMVIEFCKDAGIPYALYGFSDGNRAVIGRLSEVSRQAAILAKCQQTVAQRGDSFSEHE